MAVPALDWVPVTSSNVRAFAYVEYAHRMYVCFRSGAVYEYSGVPPEKYREGLAAGSKGRWVFEALRGHGTDSIYAYRRVA